MLKIDEIKQNSIEKIFCEEFTKLKPVPLTDSQSEVLINLILDKEKINAIEIEEKPFLYQLLEKRIEKLHNYKIEVSAMIYLTSILKSPGNVVMYCWYLQYQSKIKNIKTFTIDDLVNIFPIGFPSNDELKKVWDMQKIIRPSMEYSDNLLDYKEAGKSMF